MLSEGNQTLKPVYSMITFLITFWSKKNYRDTNQIHGCHMAGSKEKWLIVKGNEKIFRWGGSVLCLVCVRSCMTVFCQWWISLYVSHIPIKREKTLCYRVLWIVYEIIFLPPFFLLFGSSLFSVLSVSLINLGSMINCNVWFQGWDTTENWCLYLQCESDFK